MKKWVGAIALMVFNLPAMASTASFVTLDSANEGNWTGIYGADGYIVSQDTNTKVPPYAQVSLGWQGNWTWASSPAALPALQRPEKPSSRLAACWFGWSQFKIDVNLTDGKAHRVSLYALDWDSVIRGETINVLDASTGALLDSRTLSAGSFHNGDYLIWNVEGHVQFRMVHTAGANSVISGIFFDPVSAVGIPYFQGFENDTSGFMLYPANPPSGILKRYASGATTSPLGAISAASGGYYGVLTRGGNNEPWNGVPMSMDLETYFGQAGSDLDNYISPPYPLYIGPFTESISVYIPTTGPTAWTPQAYPALNGLTIDGIPNDWLPGWGYGSYSVESVMELSVPRTGTVVVGTSSDYYYDPAFGIGGGIATIINSGWYTFTMSYTKSGNMTTDPAIQVMGVYDASGNLLGSQTVAGVGNVPSSALLQTGYLDISAWQAGFANNNLAIDNVRSYLGFPNPTTAPIITSAGVASGRVGTAFNYQITATNDPTQFKATLMPVALGVPPGLSFNAATGVLAGVPTASGTYSLVVSARNKKGVGVKRITITIN